MIINGIQQTQTFKSKLSQTINSNYLLYLPKDYDLQQSKRWPFILFLHGAGERGSNVDLVKTQGLAKKLQNEPDFPFVVVSPQCPPYRAWSMDALAALLDAIESRYAIDPERIYVSGLSMGGFGTWGTSMPRTSRCSSSTSKATPV